MLAASWNPAVATLLLLSAGLHVRACERLARRGVRVARRQRAAFAAGLALVAVALLGPPDAVGDELLTMHMVQHLLLADLAAPLLIAGIRNPVLAFLLPRSVLVGLARSPLRAAFRAIRKPVPALVLFLVVLYGWHLRGPFEAALRSDWIHAAQHSSFFWVSLLVWWPALEPQRRRVPGALWKIGHIFAARLLSAMLGMALIFSRSPWYADAYGDRAEAYGLTPLGDQQTAGGIMMTLDVVVIMFALTLFFWRAASDFDRSLERAGADQPGR